MTEIPERGTRIELVHTSDLHTRLRPGDQGTTTGRYSELGGLSVAWDDGSRLALLPDEGDAWRVLPS
jgi:hypothetical protein